MQKIWSNKLILVVVISLLIISGYFGSKTLFKGEEASSYTSVNVKEGGLVISVSGTGQILSFNEIDIKSKVSGDVVYIGANNSQEVKAGKLLVQIDSDNAQKEVRDAKTSLETSNLELDRLLEPIDDLDLLIAENNLSQAKESKQKAEDNIIEGYEDAFNAITSAFLDLPTLITSLRDILYSNEIADSEPIAISYDSCNIAVLMNTSLEDTVEFVDDAKVAYEAARLEYDDNFEKYKNISRYSSEEIIEDLLSETLETTKTIAEAVKKVVNMFDHWVDYRSQYDLTVYSKVTEYQLSLRSYTSQANGHLTSLLNIQRSLQDNREDILNSQRLIEELELSLIDLEAGADDLDIRAREIDVQQKEDALFDAQQNLDDHYIRAPFDSIVANMVAKKGETISSSNVIVSLITEEKIAEITLNEIDITQVEVGQKAILSFNAIDDLSIDGKVFEVDVLGTVNQGVVSYDVKVSFDFYDERIKPGMSVSVSIVTESKKEILLLPLNAIKSDKEGDYVEVLINGVSQTRRVETGISNDLLIEITKGLKEGDEIIISGGLINNFNNQKSQNNDPMRDAMKMMR
jgi:RND family efflux transporter MFP subunit